MKSLKFFAVALVSLAVTGCTCRTAVDVTKPTTGDQIGGEVKGPLDDIYFAFDSYKLDASSKATLDKNAAWIKNNAGKRVTIEGHCDERGTTEYNQVLGANRARAAYNYLRGAGVDASTMSSVSFGEDKPFDPRHNEEAWSKNRRDHFVVE
jgi:peptidoglycan-associated lipoprotein